MLASDFAFFALGYVVKLLLKSPYNTFALQPYTVDVLLQPLQQLVSWHSERNATTDGKMFSPAACRVPKVRLPAVVSSHATSHIMNASSSSAMELPKKQSPWLLVGLGNPGQRYDGTRHNIGFEMIDAIADAEGIRLSTVQHKALIGKGEIGPAQVFLAKPQTYVNLSGESVGPLANYYRIPIQQILVIFDDMDLNFAVMRLLPKGGHGGHNGMKSVIQHLKGSRDFPRLRIGIGRPPGKMDPAYFVLQKFTKPEREEMDISIARGIDIIRHMTLNGLDKAVSTCNGTQKSQPKRSETEGKAAAHP